MRPGHVSGTPTSGALTRTRHVNVRVNKVCYRPVELVKVRRPAREFVAGRYPASRTTAERLDSMAPGNDQARLFPAGPIT